MVKNIRRYTTVETPEQLKNRVKKSDPADLSNFHASGPHFLLFPQQGIRLQIPLLKHKGRDRANLIDFRRAGKIKFCIKIGISII